MEIKPEGVSLISDWSTEHAKFDPPRACQAGGVRQATYKIKCYKTKKDVLSRISDLFPMKDRQLQIDRQKKNIRVLDISMLVVDKLLIITDWVLHKTIVFLF